MHPSRAATILATMGALLLLALIGLRAASLVEARLRVTSAVQPVERRVPVVGEYAASPDGAQITFHQTLPGTLTGDGLNTGLYAMPAAGGSIARASEPEEFNQPFFIRNGHAFRMLPGGAGMATGSPDTEKVVDGMVSPDGQELAYSTTTPSGKWRLYVLTAEGGLGFLGEDLAFYDLDWSPDSQRLAFLVPREGFDQVFTVDASGGEFRQLTADPVRKGSPRWSPDGRSIAYLTIRNGYLDSIGSLVPTAPALLPEPTQAPGPGPFNSDTRTLTAIWLMNADGTSQRPLAEPGVEAFGLFWLQPASGGRALGPEIAYSGRQPDAPQAAYLYAVNPASGQTRRAYPPLQLERLDCPASLPDGESATVRITLTNSGLLPIDAPLVLRARNSPFHPNETAGTAAVRAETITLQPGEARALDWPVRGAAGRVTYFSALFNLAEPFPVSEQHCAVPNTYLGLPNLPLLPLTLPLIISGMALCLPALLRSKKAHLWLVWALAPAAVAALVMIEMGLR